jgi:hypothetical protein
MFITLRGGCFSSQRPTPARIGLEFSGADIVHLSRDVTARRDHHGRIVRGDRRPHPRHVAAHERGPRLAVVANGRHPKPDAVRILKATGPVVGMAEAVAAAMLPHGLLGRLPRQVADQSVVHHLAVAWQELDRADPQILGPIERKHDVAVDIVAVGDPSWVGCGCSMTMSGGPRSSWKTE